MKNIIFFDGNFLELDEARLSLIEPGVLYGWSLFETMRAYRKRIVYFKEHLERIEESCAHLYLNFPYSFKKIKQIIFKLIEVNRIEDAYIRLTLFKKKNEASIFIWTKPYKPYSESKYKKGFSVCISNFKVNTDSFLTKLKTGNYLLYQLSYQKAKEKGFDEAIILNKCGYIAEASRSNIFLVKDNKLFTPSLECGCLKGITRKVIMDIARKNNIEIIETEITLEDLYKVDEAFLTNSLMGVMPLVYVEKQRIGKSEFRLTHFLRKQYNYLLKYGR